MEATTDDVRIFGLPAQPSADRRGRPSPHRVRWRVGRGAGSARNKSFRDRHEAAAFRARLVMAFANGVPFDLESGLPVTWQGVRGASVREMAHGAMVARWNRHAAKSRKSLAEGLAHAVVALTPDAPLIFGLTQTEARARAVGVLVRALSVAKDEHHPRMDDPDDQEALNWCEMSSPAVATIGASECRAALDRMQLNLDGSRAAPTTVRRRRAALSILLNHAVATGRLSASPLPSLRDTPQALHSEAIDPVRVGSPAQVEACLAAVQSDQMRAFLSTIWLSGMRPGEVAGLQVSDIDWTPDTSGWGTANVRVSAASAGSRWTNTGEVRDHRQPKHRDPGALRPVPLPPELLALLRERASDRTEGLLFCGRAGAPVSERAYGVAWHEARSAVAVALKLEPGTLRQPYDLRHSAATDWLRYLPIAEVASRLGHSAEVCRRVYEHALPSETPHYNALLNQARSAAAS